MTFSPLRRVLPLVLIVFLFGVILFFATASGARQHPQLPYWPAPPAAAVENQVRFAGLEILPKEGTKLHIHSHLNITVDGYPVVVPANVGIDTQRKLYSEIHTHDTSGILHVESARGGTFYLQQFLAEWGLTAQAHQIVNFKDGQSGTRLAVYVDQRPRATGFEGLRLHNHEDISVAITTNGKAPRVAKPFTWPKGY